MMINIGPKALIGTTGKAALNYSLSCIVAIQCLSSLVAVNLFVRCECDVI